ncbi:MAG: AAA family ATPase, partial [Alphaproteobacteria bacterium]
MQQLTKKPGAVEVIHRGTDVPEQVHVFAKLEIQAVNTALAANRPLLLKGEPGVGKSQLAYAAAKALGRAIVAKTIDANTEAHHLLWHFDAVARLAEAQVQGALLGGCADCREEIKKNIDANLALDKFVYPQALWWALNWENAARQAEKANIDPPVQHKGYAPQKGVVALIDEIDKADSHVPNGLLEALGAGSFKPFGLSERVVSDGRSPLIVITTNDERRLP